MDNNSVLQQSKLDGDEIDILTLVKRIWEKKKFVMRVTGVFVLLGVFIAVFSPKSYTSSCTFVPQNSKKSNSSLTSLAALAGINVGDIASGASALSPLIYPQILDNVDFKKELMYSKVKFADYEEPVALIDYYTNPEYSKFNMLAFVRKYTIGLPGIVIGALKNAIIKEESTESDAGGGDDAMKRYSKEEFACARILEGTISMLLEEKKGYITISASMGEALAAAQLCQITFDLLQKYVTEFKITKAKHQLSFIQGRYDETRAIYEAKQQQLAQFIDANKVISTAQARIEQERLTSEYNLANTIYAEMAKQRLQADIQVKEDTPILTAVIPVVVPYEKSAPKRVQIIVIWTFLGGLFSSGLVFGSDWLRSAGIRIKFLDKLMGEVN